MEGKASDWRPGPTVCRCCLSEGCYKDISTEYFWMGKREVYEEMLTETLNISISFSKSGGPNSNSRLICEPCIARLRDATEFKRQVIDCEKTFMHHLDPGSSSSRVTVQTIGDVKVELVKREKDTSDDDFDDRPDFLDVDSDDDLDNQPLTKLASKVPKKEAVDILDLLDNSQITVKRKATLKIKEAPPKKLKKKEVVVKPSASKPAPAKKPTEKKKGVAKQEEKISANARIRRVLTLLECSRICPFRRKKEYYACHYCDQKYIDPAELRSHNYEYHTDIKMKDLKRFTSRQARNSLIKVDVTDVSCKLCTSTIDSFGDLITHLFKAHIRYIDPNSDIGIVPYKNSLDSYKCTVCGVKFENYRTLERHTNDHYACYSCEQCGAKYISLSGLNAHLVTHKVIKNTMYCSICDKLFIANKTTCDHLKPTGYRCPHCQLPFPNSYRRQMHLFTEHGIAIREHKCNICEKGFIASSKLNSHMIKHSGEKKHKCLVCQKLFARKHSLVEHNRIHANDRRFVCNYCGRAFIKKCTLQRHLGTTCAR